MVSVLFRNTSRIEYLIAGFSPLGMDLRDSLLLLPDLRVSFTGALSSDPDISRHGEGRATRFILAAPARIFSASRTRPLASNHRRLSGRNLREGLGMTRSWLSFLQQISTLPLNYFMKACKKVEKKKKLNGKRKAIRYKHTHVYRVPLISVMHDPISFCGHLVYYKSQDGL